MHRLNSQTVNLIKKKNLYIVPVSKGISAISNDHLKSVPLGKVYLKLQS
jgi:hypothetical protein